MILIIVRHGETDYNTKGLLQGHIHGRLSVRGVNQAKKLALGLRAQKIDAIFSSDLKRAIDTTREIAKYHKVPIFYTKQLREQNYGTFQGKPFEEMLIVMQNSGLGVTFTPKGGESLAKVRNRVSVLINRLYKTYKNKTVLLSAHAGVVWSIISIYEKMPLDKVSRTRPRNTGILIIKVNDRHEGKILRNSMFR